MKKYLIILTILFCFGIVHADGITVSNFDGAWDNDTKVTTGRPVMWYIHLETPPGGLWEFTNGFRVFLSNDGTVAGLIDSGTGFTPPIADYLVEPPGDWQYYIRYSGINGIGADTVGFGGYFGFSGTDSYISHEDTWTITTQVENNALGNYLCIDSSFFPPAGIWIWCSYESGDYLFPSWDGPHCYLIEPCCQGIRGDVVGAEGIFIDDLMFLRDFLFVGGSAPDCLKAGDVTLDDQILVNDLVMLVNYLFKGGDAPPQCD